MKKFSILNTSSTTIDTEVGLRYLGGKVSSYHCLLSSFAETHSHAAQQLQEMLAGGDRASAERMAHTIKGIAATLGMMDIHEIAARIENDIHQDVTSEELARHFAGFSVALSAAVAEISTLVTAKKKSAQVELNLQEINEILVILKELLEIHDAKACSLWREHSARLSEAIGIEYALILERDIENFDYPSALTCLYAILDARR